MSLNCIASHLQADRADVKWKEIPLMDLHNKNVALPGLSDRIWVNSACVPYRTFSFCYPLCSILYHAPILSFCCVKVGLEEREQLKDQLLAADACAESAFCAIHLK